MKFQYLIVGLLLAVATFMAHAQQYQFVPLGGDTYRIEPIEPADTREVVGFDKTVEAIRSLEGIDPGATVEIMQNPSNPAPMRPCSFPDGSIRSCDNAGLTVQ